MRKSLFFVLAVLTSGLLAVPAGASQLTLWDGNAPAAAAAPTLFGQDDRQAVEETSLPPYSAVCKLLITYQNGTSGEGTGFIYGENVLATAGHVLYDPSAGRGGTPAAIEIIPGADGENRPFGSYTAVPGENSRFSVPARWRAQQDWRYDYGVLALDQAFPPEAGAFELGHYEDYAGDALQGATLSILGYDAGSLRQLLATGPVEQARRFDLLYQIGILPGQSGAPVVDKDNLVVAIQNYGVSLGSGGRCLPWNSGARLTKTAYCFLTERRDEALALQREGGPLEEGNG
ncbi:MAG: hypothetical protein HFG26_03130 [Provencibacterium sp.]|jgi:glutamyl endopeptidase|nr:hypothetical protein [Provencibacterium sp.]